MNRKGFFTLLAIVILGYFILSLSFQTSYEELERIHVIKLRVGAMDNFLKGVERDISRSLYISGFRAAIAVNEYVVNNGEFLADPQGAISELMMNGSLLGNASVLMENQTIPFWLVKIDESAQDLGLSLSIVSNNIQVSQFTPFSILIMGNFSLLLNDTTKYAASFQVQKEISAEVSIQDFEDPLYVVETNGKIRRTIVPTPFASWGIANLQLHYANGTYRATPTAPSFMKRLAGSTAADLNGIETLVDTNQLIANGIPVSQNPPSSVDYLYWKNNRDEPICSVTGITDAGNSFFRLDESHSESYDVEAQEYGCTG